MSSEINLSKPMSIGGKVYNYEICKKEIKKLRPLSIIDNTAWILTHIPAIETITDYKGIKKQANNFPFFVTSEKEIINANLPELRTQYQIPDFGPGEGMRWDPSVIQQYCNGIEKVDLKKAFEESISRVSSLLELNSKDYLSVFVLWAFGTYFYRIFEFYPYLDFNASKGSGKTRALNILKCLCYNANLSNRITGPFWARTVESTNCTLLIDEQEDLQDPKSEHSKNMLLLLNSAFNTNFTASILVPVKGSRWESKYFDVGVPVALAHINPMNDVTLDRAIPIEIQKSNRLEIVNSEIESESSVWLDLRDYYYRSFLDYFDEVSKIKNEDIGLDHVSARERNQIWKPIITLARLFERHGVFGLEGSVIRVIDETHHIKTIVNQTNNVDIQIIECLTDIVSNSILGSISVDSDWYQQSALLDLIKKQDLGYLSVKEFGNVLRRLQIQRKKKNPFGMCVYLTEEILHGLCERYGMDFEAFSAQKASQAQKNATNAVDASDLDDKDEDQSQFDGG